MRSTNVPRKLILFSWRLWSRFLGLDSSFNHQPLLSKVRVNDILMQKKTGISPVL
jgi:hypothetical protein